MKLKLEHGTSNASGVTLACPGRCNLAVTGSPRRLARAHGPVPAAPAAPTAPHRILLPLLPSHSKTSRVTRFPSLGMEVWDGPTHTQSSQLGWPPRSTPGTRGSGVGTDGALGEQSSTRRSPRWVHGGPAG